MVTLQEKTQCVSWFIETKSDVQTQQTYRTKYGNYPPTRFFNSSLAHEIYGDKVNVGYSEKSRATKSIIRRFFILRIFLQHVICKLFSFWLVI